ncbi:MAG: carboxypeptidase-like regulatory domain-containing protein [Candidatus Marinimicrobia bacterium]|nr:carboxypeptidase-like regulatory domain-containing protein [Candidatus Neomarinimicrobiota bacterium]
MVKRYFVLLLSLLFAVSAFAADGKVSGRVLNAATDEPLIGANVIIDGAGIGTASDNEGNFSFEYEVSQTAYLIIGYMGFKTQKVELNPGDQTTGLVIRLAEDILETQRVVVTGLASSTSKEKSGVSVASVKAEKLTELNSYSSISQLLDGKVAGAALSSSSGNLGGGFKFDIRSGAGLNGDGQPVIYIDGVRANDVEFEGAFGKGGQMVSTMSALNPEIIESVEILKGPAAAAEYGTDGSNGVVLITTKKGKLAAGGKGYSVNYKYETGHHEQSYKYTKDDIESYKAANSVFRDGDFTKQNLLVQGGGEMARYFISLGQGTENGIMLNNKLDRKNLRINIDANASEKLNFSAGLSWVEFITERPENDNNIYGWLGNTVLRTTPFGWLDSLSIAATEEELNIKQVTGFFKSTYSPIKNLKADFTLGVDNTNTMHISYYPPWGGYLYDHGSRQLYDRQNLQFTYDGKVGYKYDILDGLVGNTKVGFNFMEQTFRSNWLQMDSLASDKIKDIEIASENQLQYFGESFVPTRKGGIYLYNYFDWQEKVMAELNIRKEYANSLSQEISTIVYPKASLAVRLDKFGLTPSMFDYFKLRTAYGETGRLPGANDIIELIWAAEPSGYGAGLTISEIGNLKLKPERVKEMTFGMDFSVWNRYNIEMTYSKVNTEDGIYGQQLAPSTGKIATSIPVNVGETKGWAFELTLDGRLVDQKNVKVDFTQTNSWQGNEVVDLGGKDEAIWSAFDTQIIQEGLPIRTFYQQDIDEITYDDNGKFAGYTLTEDYVDLGSVLPNYRGSFSLDFTLYKNFQIHSLFKWQMGSKILNYTKVYQTYFGNNADYNNAREIMAEADSTSNYGSKYKNAVEDFVKYRSMLEWGTYVGFIESADYLKLQELSVSYNASDLINKYVPYMNLNSLRLTFSAQNLLTWKDYSGPDPEVNMDGARSTSQNMDFMTLQHPRTFTFTVQVGL